MPVVLVANPKGGVGKSTLATNIAGYFASRGHAVMLGDIDRQQSSRLWLGLRTPQARDRSGPGRPRRTATSCGRRRARRMPCSTRPPACTARASRTCWPLADKVLVPLQPSIFDIFATRDFLDELLAHRHVGKTQVGLVGMRVDARTLAADRLHEFVARLGLPVLGYLRDTQNYVQLAARGLTLFDVAPGRVSATSSSGSRSVAGSMPEPVTPATAAARSAG